MTSNELLARLTHIRESANDLYSVIRDEERGRIKRWEEEKPALESLIVALTESKEIIRKEKKRVKADLVASQAKNDKEVRAAQRAAAAAVVQANKDIKELQRQLAAYNTKLLALDLDLRTVQDGLGRQQRPDEREMDTTKLVVLQDTRRLITLEISKLNERIVEIEARVKIDTDRKIAEDSGWGEFSRLEEQVAAADARIDVIKQMIYFPSVKGYRFSGGSDGVYLAAKDLYISELSGRFHVDIEPVVAKDGAKSARLTFSLSGVTASPDRNEFKVPNRRGMDDTSSSGGSPRRVSRDRGETACDSPLRSSSDRPSTSAYPTPLAHHPVQRTATRPAERNTGTGPMSAHGAAAGPGSALAAGYWQNHGSGAPRSAPATPMPVTVAVATPSALAVAQLDVTPPQPGLTRLMAPGLARVRVSDAGGTAGATSSSARAAELAAGGASLPRRVTRIESNAAHAGSTASLPPQEQSLDELMRTYDPPETVKASPSPLLAATEAGAPDSGGTADTKVLLTNLLPKSKKKGAMVASFLSGLSKKKDKMKSLFGSDKRNGLADDPLVPLSSGKDESGSKVSKFAKSLAQKIPLAPGKGASAADAAAHRLAAAEAIVEQHAARNRTYDAVTRDSAEPPISQPTNVTYAAPALLAAAEAATSRASRMLDARSMPGGSSSMGGGEPAGCAGGTPFSTDASYAQNTETDDIDSMLYQSVGPQQSRKGVYVQLLGEGVEILGERGTRVPDVQMRELVLELELTLSMVVNYSPVEGWQAPTGSRLNFDVVRLEHQMRGNSLPLPRAALKALVNMYVPSVLVGAIMPLLPVELGQYVINSGETLSLTGEFKVIGPVLSTFAAHLVPPAKPPPDTPRKAMEKWAAVAAASASARAMLGLTDAQAMALSELFSGRSSLLEVPKPLSVVELCRFLQVYQRSSMWTPLCNMWNKAWQLALAAYGAANPSDSLTFGRFMDSTVSRIARKPVRVAMQVTKLHLALDADVALTCVRDYFERMAKEFFSKGDDEGGDFTEPLEVQLENLSLWAMALFTLLRQFRSKFHSAGCSVMASVDREMFQVGAENVHYDGPLKLQIPLEVMTDADHAFVWDIKLPDRDEHMNSMTALLQEVIFSLSGTVASGSAGNPGGRSPQARSSADGATGTSTTGDNAGGATINPRAPVLQNAVVGQVSLRKLGVALRLDEQRMAELLQSGSASDAGMLAQMMGCMGDLFSAGLDVGWRAGASDGDEPRKAQAMLRVQNNDVTRVRLDVESLMFQSTVSPSLSVRVLYAVVAAMTLRFHSATSYNMRFWDKAFQHIHEYLSKDVLDAFVFLTARAETLAGGTKLRVVLSGDPANNPQGLKSVSPVYFVNEVNLLTVIDTLKLMSDTQR